MDDHVDTETAEPESALNQPDADVPTDCRVQRIQEHVKQSLELTDPLQAVIGAASGDLFLIQYQLHQGLTELLQQGTASPSALADVLPAVNTLMKVHHQVDRYVQLSLKIKQTGQAG